jgi:hypothetical protein
MAHFGQAIAKNWSHSLKIWMGFIKLHLEHPHMDNITLFKGTRAFVMKMEDGESIVGKVEKGFELTTNSLQDNTANDISKEIIKPSYYNGDR